MRQFFRHNLSLQQQEQRQRMTLLEDRMEAVDDTPEHLLIFPTQAGLKRSLNLMELYFALERDVLVAQQQQQEEQESSLESLISKQSAILVLARTELKHRKTASLSTNSSSCCPTTSQ